MKKITLLFVSTFIILLCISCFNEEEEIVEPSQKVSLMTPQNYDTIWLPDAWNDGSWYQYFVDNDSWPDIKGREVTHEIILKVEDNNGEPIQNFKVNISSDFGVVSTETSYSDNDGNISFFWSTHGEWGTWGNHELHILSELDTNPIIITWGITAPPGV